MLSIKNNIIENADVDRYSNDEYCLKLMSGIKSSNNFYELIDAFINHSKAVEKDMTAGDYLNACDGNNSPLSLLIYELMKNENFEYYAEYLSTIKTEEDYNNHYWILNEINILLWTNPIVCKSYFELFIRHPIVGKYFSIDSACWVNSCYYDCNGISVKDVDNQMVEYLKLYKSLYMDNPKSVWKNQYTTYIDITTDTKLIEENYKLPFTWKYYMKEAKEHFKFRELTKEDFPKTMKYILNEIKNY